MRDDLLWPNNTPMAGVAVEIFTLAPLPNEEAFSPVSQKTVVGKITVRTQITGLNPGRLEVDLIPTANLIPVGTVYQAIVKIKGSVVYNPIFTVPDSGPAWIGANLTDAPGALASPALGSHITNPTGAHAATAISNAPAGSIAATTVQAALDELDTEKEPLGAYRPGGTDVAVADGGTGASTIPAARTILELGVDPRNYGGIGNGVADDTAAMNAALQALAATGGVLVLPPTTTFRCDGQLVIPNSGAPNYVAAPIRITGGGPGFAALSAGAKGGSILDLRYAGPDAKILALGTGTLEIDHLSLIEGGAGSTPFLLTTSTTIHLHDLYIKGSKSGLLCNQDVLLLGGLGTVSDGSVNAPFQGYGSVIREIVLDGIRRAVYGRTYCNGVVIRDIAAWQSCGSNLPGGACIELLGLPTSPCSGNVIDANLIEVPNYPYAVKLSEALHNSVVFNNFYDPQTATLAYVRLDVGAIYNLVIAGFSSDSKPTMSEEASVVGKNTLITAHQSQETIFAQPLTTKNDLRVKNLLKVSGPFFDIQPDAARVDSLPMVRMWRSAAEAANPGTNVFELLQSGKMRVGGASSGELVFEDAAGALKASILAGLKQWILAGAGGEMTIDSGTGGSYFNIKGFRFRFIDHTGARKVALAGAAPSDASIAAGEMVLYPDSTSGAAKLMVKIKDDGGIVRTGQVALT